MQTLDRPADVLTTAAVPGRQTALDITIAAQDAQHAGRDACASAYRRKMIRYSNILPALDRAGIIFQPMVWSAEGRPHPATTRVMDSILRYVRAKRGEEAMAGLRERWRHEIAIAIQRRKAAMIRATLPLRTSRQEWLEQGGGGTHAGSRQLPTIEEEAEEEQQEEEEE